MSGRLDRVGATKRTVPNARDGFWGNGDVTPTMTQKNCSGSLQCSTDVSWVLSK